MQIKNRMLWYHGQNFRDRKLCPKCPCPFVNLSTSLSIIIIIIIITFFLEREEQFFFPEGREWKALLPPLLPSHGQTQLISQYTNSKVVYISLLALWKGNRIKDENGVFLKNNVFWNIVWTGNNISPIDKEEKLSPTRVRHDRTSSCLCRDNGKKYINLIDR